jgi:hypothetical protein
MYRIRGEARRTITREAHGAVLTLHGDSVPKDRADWHYDLRRGRLCIYGGLLRFIDACISRGRPDIARASVAWLSWYIDEQTGPTTTGEMKAIA